MTYQPVIPSGGNLGWAFLKHTREAQQDAFDNSALIERQTAHFAEKINGIMSAEDLVNDRQLLSVALGAFGLGDDVDNKFYIRKVLEEGVTDDEAFANRLADKRYFAMAKAFGFDRAPPNTVISGFAESIVAQYRTREFEASVGAQDENLRLAMSLERDLANLTEQNLSEDATWYTIMGTPPLRRVFETALGLPTATGAIDVDKQLEIFREKSLAAFGTTDPKDFDSEEMREDLTRKFLLRAELDASTSRTVKGSVALSLLSAQGSLIYG